MLPTRPYRSLFEQADRLMGLPTWNGRAASVWLEAVCMQESSGRAAATRYEPALDRVQDQDTPGVNDHTREDDTSYGLFQVLGSTYKDVLGIPQTTPLDFAVLFNPVLNTAIACMYLQRLIAAILRGTFVVEFHPVARALARYNGGGRGDVLVPGPNPDSLVMRRQEYVDSVWHWIGRVEQDRREEETRRRMLAREEAAAALDLPPGPGEVQ